ncbi:MAG: FkbM family methyltransferase [Fibromonadaceae bacterium]|jgi:FkbM family methyltransferase|nr:FkbM family methyltransferase [Fibromonadaceae bacterium]
MLEKDFKNAYIVISTWFGIAYEILEKLLNIGFSREKIFWFPPLPLGDEQYFGLDFINFSDNEIYVDVGCFDGYTIEKFIQFCGGKYKKIYGMEPDPINFDITKKCITNKGFENVALIAKGAWSKEDILSFSNNASGSSKISSEGVIKVPVTSIDEMVGDDAVTFIKMDIEGTELEALKGAVKTISRNKPKLAICVYHNAIDILEIPIFIDSLISDYKYYLRHHTNSYPETVLYAVP